MDYIIQMRVTRTTDKHVCKVCGNDAYLCGVGYEATNQELTDELNNELQRAQTWEEVRNIPLNSSVSDAIFAATVTDQQVSGPREYERFYQCAVCCGNLLSAIMGNGSGYSALAVLLGKSREHALFCARKIDIPDKCLLVMAPRHDPHLALNALRDETTPHFDASQKRGERDT